MQALLHDVVEKMGSYLTRLQLHLAVTHWTKSAIRFRPSDWDIATQLTEQAPEEWSSRMGFVPQPRTIENSDGSITWWWQWFEATCSWIRTKARENRLCAAVSEGSPSSLLKRKHSRSM